MDEKCLFLSGYPVKQSKQDLLMIFYRCILLSSVQYLYEMQKHKMIAKNYQHRDRVEPQQREFVKKGIVEDLDTSPSEENVYDDSFSKYFIPHEETYSIQDFIMNLRAVDYRCYNEILEDEEEMKEFEISCHPPIRCLDRINREYLLALGVNYQGRNTRVQPVEQSRVRFQTEMHVKFYNRDAPATSIQDDEQYLMNIEGHQMINEQSLS